MHYGTSSGHYTTTVDVGNMTTWTGAFADGLQYFFAVSVYTTTGVESPLSAEVVGGSLALLSITPASAAAGTPITVTMSNGPGSVSDWVGLYATGSPDGSNVAWMYLNGSQTMPTTGLTSATLQFTAPSTPGTYNARFFTNGGATKAATSNTVTVTQSLPVLTVTTPTVNAGTAINFTVANGPGNASDWVALFTTSAGNSGYVAWMYLNGTTTLPTTGLTSATLQFTAPTAAPGTYNVRWFSSGWTAPVISSPVTVQGSLSPTIAVATPTVTPGAAISFTVANGPGNLKDWVGLYATGANDGAAVAWTYLNGLQTAPTTGLSSAALQFAAPATPGTYEVRWFMNNGYTRLATSATITVQASLASPAITVTTTTVTPGAAISFTVANGPGNLKDWVGLYATGANDGAASVWTYLNGLQTAPTTGLTSAALQFAAPATPGTYEIRWFSNNGFTRLATSATITVQASLASPAITVTTPTVTAGAAINFTVANGPGNLKDWVGLYATGANDGAAVVWTYLNGLQTAPTTGLTSATLQFAAPAMLGTYEVRWFSNNGFTRLATSAIITVQ